MAGSMHTAAKQLQVPTTVEGWEVLQEYFRMLVTPNVSNERRNVFWVLMALVLLSTILYGMTLLKALRTTKSGRMWWTKDAQGYWHPSIAVAIPSAAITYGIFDFSSLLCLQTDFDSHLRGRTVALMLMSYSACFCIAIFKLWALIYALPPSPFKLASAYSKSSHPFTPRQLTIFVTTFFAVTFGCTIPPIFYVSVHTHNLYTSYQGLSNSISAVISALQTSADPSAAVAQALADVNALSNQADKAFLGLRVYAGAAVTIILLHSIIMGIVSFVILRALRSQVKIFRRALEHRRALATAEAVPYSSDAKINEDTASVSISDKSSFMPKVNSWFPDLRRDAELDHKLAWLASPAQGRPSVELATQTARKNEPGLRVQYERLARYYVNTYWQIILNFVISASFVALTLCLVANVWNAPIDMSMQSVVILTAEWGQWTWGGGPGVLLGLISVVVAYAPGPVVPTSEPNTIIPLDVDDSDDEGDFISLERPISTLTSKGGARLMNEDPVPGYGIQTHPFPPADTYPVDLYSNGRASAMSKEDDYGFAHAAALSTDSHAPRSPEQAHIPLSGTGWSPVDGNLVGGTRTSSYGPIQPGTEWLHSSNMGGFGHVDTLRALRDTKRSNSPQ